MYDIILVPIILCFSLTDYTDTLSVNLAINLAAASFWSVDIVLNSCSILGQCLRQGPCSCKVEILWLVLDIVVTSIDWFLIMVDGIGGDSPLRLLRRWRGLDWNGFYFISLRIIWLLWAN